MNSNVGLVAEFQDKYGEKRIIHGTRHGLRGKRSFSTPALAMNRATTGMIGAKIKALREERGFTLKELALRCGMAGGTPKNRMWAIENATRGEGVRIGTLYAIAHALGCQVADLLPSVEEVLRAAKAKGVSLTTLEVMP